MIKFFIAILLPALAFAGYDSTVIPLLKLPTTDTVRVSSGSALRTALENAVEGRTILLADDTFYVAYNNPLRVTVDRVSIYGASKDPTKAVLIGDGFGSGYTSEELLKVEAFKTTLAYFTICNVRANGLKIQTEDADSCRVHNLRFIDICERSIKVPEDITTYDFDVGYCYFEQKTEIDSSIPNLNLGGDYIGGIDAMKLKRAKIHDNYFYNIRGMHGEGRAAIFLWHENDSCTVERNTIVNCDRGISLGASQYMETMNHVNNSYVRNNMIYSFRYDATLEMAGVDSIFCGNNTFYKRDTTGTRGIRSIGYYTNVFFTNNLCRARVHFDGGTNTGMTLTTNLINTAAVNAIRFADTAHGELRPIYNYNPLINTGTYLSWCRDDWSRTIRDTTLADIGADHIEWRIAGPLAMNGGNSAETGRILAVAESANIYIPYTERSSFGTNGNTITFHGIVRRFGQPRSNSPVIIHFIQWGGTLEGATEKTQYNGQSYDPYLLLSIMPKDTSDRCACDNSCISPDQNCKSWYWGNTWDSAGTTWSNPWAHLASVDIINKLKQGLLDTALMGCTVDTNRIYAFGSSIGGTATLQVGMKHPEIFAAIQSGVGWTNYHIAFADDNHFFHDTSRSGCMSFSGMIGGTESGDNCLMDSSVLVRGNWDQPHRGVTANTYMAWKYTDLKWYFENYRSRSEHTPFLMCISPYGDDVVHQGDNLIPTLDAQNQSFWYHRPTGSHSSGSQWIWWDAIHNFRKNQSYLAFTNRENDDFGDYNPVTGMYEIGYTSIYQSELNDLREKGWAPNSIVEDTNHYFVKLTGTGMADVTLRNLQRLKHTFGTSYQVYINGALRDTVTADQYDLITIPTVDDSATIELFGGWGATLTHTHDYYTVNLTDSLRTDSIGKVINFTRKCSVFVAESTLGSGGFTVTSAGTGTPGQTWVGWINTTVTKFIRLFSKTTR